MTKKYLKILWCSAFAFSVFGVNAQVKPFSLFTDNMVLQREVEVPIWGTALDCKTVTIEFNGQKKEAPVVDGKWMVKLSPMKANAASLDMRFISDKNEVVLHNIAIGEVWLAGGQSNMERQLGPRPPQKPLLNWETEAAAANYPLIREFSLPRNNNSKQPVTSINAKWKVCNPTNVVSFSAVAYYFARQLHQQINVPVGIIHSSWGGTEVEKWMRKELFLSNPDFALANEKYEQVIVNYQSKIAAFNLIKDSLTIKWKADSAFAVAEKRTIPQKPQAPSNPNPMNSGNYGSLYKTMIEPLIPYAIKGVIWYQGESNIGNPELYAKMFPRMIKDWRSQWGLGEFPFLFVQIAPFRTNTPEIREAQLYTAFNTPKTAMVVTLDCGDTTDIHPTNKKPVGERLALAARALAYGEKKLEYAGPIYQSFKTKNNAIEIRFTHAKKGLKVQGDSLVGFTISANRIDYVPANAMIVKNKVVVSAASVTNPVAVRYAFIKNAVGNLFNFDGLPASPFRTDTPFEKK